MFSRSLPRHLFSILALTAALAPSGCIAGTGDPVESEEGVSTDSEAIIGGTSVTTQYPEAAIIVGVGGNVPSGQGAYCSATLIAPKVVLTAGHCVYGPTTWQVNVGAQSRNTTRAATFDWNDATFNSAHHDVGLLFLDQAIVLASYPTIAQTAAAATSQVLNVGRIHNGLTNMLWGAVTTDLSSAADIPFYYLTNPNVLEAGDSGGPDFLSGTHTIIAVNSGVRTVPQPGSTLELGRLARVDQIYSWIHQPIDDSSFFVREAYLDVLGREPDSAGFAWWLNVMQSCNGAPACLAGVRVDMTRGMLESAETRAKYPELSDPASAGYKAAFLTHCYTSFLRRQPDTAGYNYWLPYLTSTSDYSGVVGSMLNSAEYRGRFGAP